MVENVPFFGNCPQEETTPSISISVNEVRIAAPVHHFSYLPTEKKIRTVDTWCVLSLPLLRHFTPATSAGSRGVISSFNHPHYFFNQRLVFPTRTLPTPQSIHFGLSLKICSRRSYPNMADGDHPPCSGGAMYNAPCENHLNV